MHPCALSSQSRALATCSVASKSNISIFYSEANTCSVVSMNESLASDFSSARFKSLNSQKIKIGDLKQNRISRKRHIPKINVISIKNQIVAETEKQENSNQVVPHGSVSVVLLAGGVGKRMGANMPKQYLPLLGQPIALYSLKIFSELPEVGEIVVVCDPSYKDIFSDASKNINTQIKFAIPGKERQDSVFNGFNEINKESLLVAIHDSARPLITKENTKKVISDAIKYGAAVLAVPVKATIKEANSDQFVSKTLDRKILWEMQTPQVIKPHLLRKGFELVQRENLEVTDDVSIVEHLKEKVFITQGCYTNLKITTPEDLLLAEKLLSNE